jgi:copper(I)-binding protein
MRGLVPAHGKLALQKGGKHVMLFGLRAPKPVLPLALVFERSGRVLIDAVLSEYGVPRR